MIACLGPNPAVDRTALVESLELDEVLRPIEVVTLPGGKALCTARAARALGASVSVGLIVGGHAGRWVAEAAESEGLDPIVVDGEVETRTTYTIVDRRGRWVALYEPSQPVPERVFDRYLELVTTELVPKAGWLILAGSLPSGIQPTAAADIVERCRRADRPCLVDTSGPALQAALAARPPFVKVSRSEAEAIGCGSGAPGWIGVVDAARSLVARGATIAIVTDGSRGSVATDGHRLWLAEAPRVRAVCAVGSGDAFTAGLVVALAASRSIDEALAWATAAGAANALHLGAGRLSPSETRVLLEQVRIEERPLHRRTRRRPGNLGSSAGT